MLLLKKISRCLFTFLLIILLGSEFLHAQERNELESRRAQLLSEIQITQKALNQHRLQQSEALTALELLDIQINKKEELVALEREILSNTENKLMTIDADLIKLKSKQNRLSLDFEKTVRHAYRKHYTVKSWMYVWTSANLHQAWLRLRYLRQIAQQQKKQIQEWNALKDSIAHQQQQIQDLLGQKQRRIIEIAQVQKQLTNDKTSQELKIKDLANDHDKLRSQLKAQKADRDKLNAAIERLIAAEIEASGTSSKLDIPLTPFMVAVGKEFQSNKGKLNWPVERALVRRQFGAHRHPELPNVSIQNNGIDLQTQEKAVVKAVFEGKIIANREIPGMGTTVIIQHGAFYTVYSYLAASNVVSGETISTGDQIGRARKNAYSQIYEIHFEIWKQKELQDPIHWLYQR